MSVTLSSCRALLGRCITRLMVLPAAAAIPVRRLPVCTVQTNLGPSVVPTDFTAGLSKVIAKTLNKPEQLISVSLLTNVSMVRGGTESATAIVEIWSVGVFDAERNRKYTKDLFEYLTTALKLPGDRIALMLHPLELHEAAHLIYRDMQQQK